MDRRGTYIAFAGVDGAGKTTHAQCIVDRLIGEEVRATFVPSESMLPVRTMLDRIARRHGHRSYIDLLGADTARLLGAVLKWRSLGALRDAVAEPGSVTVTDRGVLCQYAVVRVFGGTNEWLLREMFEDAPEPDLTVFLDIPGEIAAARLAERGEVSHTPRELDELADAYRSLPEFADFAVVDGRGSLEETHEAVMDAVRPVLPGRR